MNRSQEKMDQVDKDILAMLHQDGRTTNNDIARELAVSEGTVRNRIKKLIDNGALKITGLVNPDFMPEKNLVLLGVKVALSKDLGAIAEKIAGLSDVTSVYIITGKMDIMVEAFVDSKFGLINFIDSQLASVEGVVSTETHVVMKHYSKWIDLDVS